MSQPDVYPSVFGRKFKRSLSVPTNNTRKRPRGMISEYERDEKIKEFERYVSDREITSRFEIKTADKTVYFSYFIGRLNPPHRGHITALIDLVLAAKQNKSKTLILLGSGPKPKHPNKDRRTLDDPITFETKKAFVVSKLVDAGGTDEIDFTVKKMTTPHADVANYIKVVLEEIKEKNGVISKIDIKHMAGGKDDDAAKLKSVLTYVTDVARQEVPSGEVSSEVVVSPPPPSETGAVATYMSATNVRKHAYQTQLPGGNGYDDWPDSYKTFYGPSARDIFNEILYPLEKITESERVAAINEYVDPVPKPSNRKSTKTQKKTRGGRKTRRKSRIRKKRTCH